VSEPLSPQAQAVEYTAYKAWITKDDPRSIAAAVIRAAADQLVAVEELPQVDEESCMDHLEYGYVHSRQNTRLQLLAIATELEADR
jgi:hypothetical protein